VTASPAPRAPWTPEEPWFRRHSGLALTVAVALFAAVFALRMLTGTPVDVYSMLYALPVALVATAFGLRAGTVAGLLAVGLTVLWAVVQDITLTPTGWASRVLPLLLLGVLVGHATDRERWAEKERRRLQAAALLHREAIEINDSLVQGMVAVKWSLEAGRVDAGTEILDQTIVEAQDLVSGLIRRAGMGARTESRAPRSQFLNRRQRPAADGQQREGLGSATP
jgi:uncharacterized membrane protein